MGYIDDTAQTLGLKTGNAYRIINAVAFYIRMKDAMDTIKAKTKASGKDDSVYASLAKKLDMMEKTVRSLDNTSDDALRVQARNLYGVTKDELNLAIGDVDQQIRWINNKNSMLYPKPNFDSIKHYYDTLVKRVMPLDYWRMIYNVGQRTSLDSIIAQYSGMSATDISKEVNSAVTAINKGTNFNQMIGESLGKDAKTVESEVATQVDAINKEIFMDVSRRMINATGSTTWDSIASAVGRSKEYIIGNHPFFKNRVTTIVNARLSKGSYPDIKKELLNRAKTDVTLKVSSAVWFQANITDAKLRSKTILPNTDAGKTLAEEAARILYNFCNYLLLKDKVIKAQKKGQSNLAIAESLNLIKPGETKAERKKNAIAFVDLLKKYDY